MTGRHKGNAPARFSGEGGGWSGRLLSASVASAPRIALEPRPPQPYSLSLVVPVHNEEAVLSVFHRRTSGVLGQLGVPYEIVYVNDGSRDATLPLLHQLRDEDPNVAVVDLSRNFGKEIALSAGLNATCGDAVVVMDADLQDPPELIPQLLDGWREGFDVVYGVRVARESDGWLKRVTARWFYRLIQQVSRVRIPADAGDFRLLSRRVVDTLRALPEQHRFMKGLYAWIGYPQKAVPYRRGPRAGGRSSWTLWNLWNLAIEGFTSFTTMPLRVASYLGLAVAGASFTYGLWIVYKTLRFGEPVQGYPSTMVVILFLGGVQLLAIGVLGEYLGRVFNEVKRRPLYLVNRVDPSRLGAERGAGCAPDSAPPDVTEV
jgi:polyisoprenyl-phosphate glycosyltransferase